MIGLVSVTAVGRSAAERLERAWPDARTYDGPAADALPRAFHECDGVVCFLAVGATVRRVTPPQFGSKKPGTLIQRPVATTAPRPTPCPARSANATPW